MACSEATEPPGVHQNELPLFVKPLSVTGHALSSLQVSQKQDQLTTTVRELKRGQQALYSLGCKSTQGQKSQTQAGVKKLTFRPIDNLDSLENLENVLKEETSVAELKKKLSVVCAIGKGKGPNNCFVLVDVMFTRNFLTKCSWAGGSRTEGTKICFKGFNRVIQLFFSIIYDSDNTYSLVDCEAFFKNILRNAVRRNCSKRQRASSTKLRLKKRQI